MDGTDLESYQMAGSGIGSVELSGPITWEVVS
jgi:hypothetical protein